METPRHAPSSPAAEETSRGQTLLADGRLDEAESCFRRAVARDPEHAPAIGGLADVLRRLDKWDAAADCCRRSLALQPDSADSHFNLGTALLNVNRLDEAVEAFARAIELRPSFAAAHRSRGEALLLAGRYAQGWPEYEWRFAPDDQVEDHYKRPRWDGGAADGQTILICSEQGLGDCVQFVRFAEQVKRRGATVLVECAAPLVRLMATAAGVDRVVDIRDPLPEFDLCIPLMSLPGMLGTTLETIPHRAPYLSADPQSVAGWSQELAAGEAALRIGIAWHGNPQYGGNHKRSFPVTSFAAIAALPGVRLYNLQFGDGREQLDEVRNRWPTVDLGDRLGAFDNTAAIMSNLDLVISCDSAPAHLAGALGLPVWVPLAFTPNWRWLLSRTDSPWYPTMRLFRQTRPGDWDGAFAEIERGVKQLLRARGFS